MTDVPPLAGLAEVADMLGVSRQRGHQIAHSKGFPDPVQTVRATPLWLASEVAEYVRHARLMSSVGTPEDTP